MSDVTVDAFLADAVTAVAGKLYALGAGWNRIVVAGLPATHDRIGIGLLVHLAGTSERRQHRFAIRLETPDGSPLVLGAGSAGPITAIEGEFSAQGGDATIPVAMQLDRLPFQVAGRYAVVVSIDGEDRKTLGFHVLLQTQVQATPEQPSTGTAGYL
jgi:hypothetical protein